MGRLATFRAGMLGNPEVLSLFARQYWVASLDQLRQVGVGKRAVGRAKALGLIDAACPRVYRVASAPFPLEARAMALLLQAPAGSYISGRTAGRLYGLRNMPELPVEITVGAAMRVAIPNWARVSTSFIGDPQRDVSYRPDGLVVASPLRTLLRLAAVFNQHRFERAAEDMWHRGLVEPHQAAEYLDVVRRSGRNGVKRFATWLEKTADVERPGQSGLELDLLDRITRSGLPEPQRQYPLQLANGDVIHIDLAWPRVRLGLEPGHTWWHGGDSKMRSDQARDRACDEVGWRILRYDEVSAQEAGVVRQIERIYYQRLAQSGPSPHPPR